MSQRGPSKAPPMVPGSDQRRAQMDRSEYGADSVGTDQERIEAAHRRAMERMSGGTWSWINGKLTYIGGQRHG